MLLVLALSQGAALGAEKKVDDARHFYEEGTKYYALGEFQKAIENYKKAYEVKPDPVFLYNIGQAYRLANDPNQALFFYKSYLRGQPNAPNRVEVQGRIKDLEATIASQKTTLMPPNDPVAPGGVTPPAVTPPTVTPPAVTPPSTTTAGTTVGTTTEPGTTTTTGTTPQVPSAEDVARKSEGDKPAVTIQGGGTPQPSSRPFYTKWWFWTAVGVVVVGAAVGGIAVASSGGGSSPPSGDFPSVAVF